MTKLSEQLCVDFRNGRVTYPEFYRAWERPLRNRIKWTRAYAARPYADDVLQELHVAVRDEVLTYEGDHPLLRRAWSVADNCCVKWWRIVERIVERECEFNELGVDEYDLVPQPPQPDWLVVVKQRIDRLVERECFSWQRRRVMESVLRNQSVDLATDELWSDAESREMFGFADRKRARRVVYQHMSKVAAMAA